MYLAKDSKTKQVVDWWAMDGGSQHVIEDKARLVQTSCQAKPDSLVEFGKPAGEKQLGVWHDGVVDEKKQQQQKQEQLTGEGDCVAVDPEKAVFDFMYDSSMIKVSRLPLFSIRNGVWNMDLLWRMLAPFLSSFSHTQLSLSLSHL